MTSDETSHDWETAVMRLDDDDETGHLSAEAGVISFTLPRDTDPGRLEKDLADDAGYHVTEYGKATRDGRVGYIATPARTGRNRTHAHNQRGGCHE